MSVEEEEVVVEEEIANGAEVEGEVAEREGEVVEQEEQISGLVGTVSSQIPTSALSHDHMAAQTDFMQELAGVATEVAREVADAFVAERRLFIQESIAEGKLVTTLEEASQAIELRTREQLCSRDCVLSDQLGCELVAHVLKFGFDSDEVVADTARHVLETLYDEQWSAYLPTFHEQRAQLIAEEVDKVSHRRILCEVQARMCTCSRDFMDVLIVQVRGFEPPSWVQHPQRTLFSVRSLAQEMSESFGQAGYKVEVDHDLLFVSWQ